MGYIKHHAIVVTSYKDEAINLAHAKAKDIFNQKVSEILESEMNSYKSFFIPPDGSKEGWEDSEKGDYQRKMFVDWIKEQNEEDGSNSLDFCEFFYGEDNGWAQIENHN